MATISWANPVSGAFTTAADWGGGVVPAAGDDALLTVAGAAYTVTITTASTVTQTVNSLQLASNATALISANSNFQMTDGTGSGADAGQIQDDGNLVLAGGFDDTSKAAQGGIFMAGSGAQINLLAYTTFTGGGAIVLGGNGGNTIDSLNGLGTLENVSDTFSGYGNIGDDQFNIDNDSGGTIDANTTGVLTIETNGLTVNTGLLEATQTGVLYIDGAGVDNYNGVISASGPSGQVDLYSTYIEGGTLKSSGGGAIDAIGARTTAVSTLNGLAGAVGQAVTITAGTNVNVIDGAALYIEGAIVNAGVITLQGAADETQLLIGDGTTTLTGGGQVVFDGANNNLESIYGFNLVNTNNTLDGAGNIGDGSLTLINQAAGVINANQTAALELDVNGGVTNTGLIEATNTGGLLVYNTTIDDAGASNTGKLYAETSGSHVDLSDADILGGVIKAVSGAQIDTVAGTTSTLDGTEPGASILLESGSHLNLNDGSILNLNGAIANQGVISLNGVTTTTELEINAPVTTLTGGGQIVLGGADNEIIGATAANELDNTNNTISGAGALGLGQLTFVNEGAGVVDANQATALTLDATVVNKGLLEDTGTGGLVIAAATIDNTQNGNAGRISAVGAGAHVDFEGLTFIEGGTLSTSGSGAVFNVLGGSSTFLDGASPNTPVTLTAGSTLAINAGAAIGLEGTVNNQGTIVVGANGVATNGGIAVTTALVTLEGGGDIDLANNGGNVIVGAYGAARVLDNVNNTIQGSGDVGAAEMGLINGVAGVIDANQAAGGAGSNEPGAMELDANLGVTNYGAIEASVGTGQTAGGTLLIENTNILEYSTGSVDAYGTATLGSTVELQGATIGGGTLNTTGASSFQVVAGQTATFDGSVFNIGVNAVVDVLDGSTLDLKGNVNVSKSINLQAATLATSLIIDSPVVDLTGGGQINMGDNALNIIASTTAPDQALINYDDTIQGAGLIGDATYLELSNDTRGVIDANQAVALVLDDAATVENNGLIESNTTVAGAGGLVINATVIDNTISNPSGVLNTGQMLAAGTGHIDLNGATINGGTLTTTGAAYIDVLASDTATLDGAVLGQAVNIAAGSQVIVNDGATLKLIGTLNNAGTLDLTNVGTVESLVIDSAVVTLTGGGQVLMGGTAFSQIVGASAGLELNNVNNTIIGSGYFGTDSSTTTALDVVNGVAGTIEGIGAGMEFSLADTLANAGTMLSDQGQFIINEFGGGLFYNTGTIISTAEGVLIGCNVSGAGKEIIQGASILDMEESVGGAANQSILFSQSASAASTGAFYLALAQDFTGTVTGLSTGNELDLLNVTFSSATLTYAGNTSGGVLTVSGGGVVSTINLVGNYTQANFAMATDGSSGTIVTYKGGAAPTLMTDTAADFTAAALNAAEANSALTSILVTDSGNSLGGFVNVTVAELTADATALGKLSFANGSSVALKVDDTAADLSGTGMDAAEANSHVTAVVVSDNGSGNGGRVQLDINQLTTDARVLATLVFANGQTKNTIRIDDTAANVSAALNSLDADAQVGRILVSDNAAVTVNVGQLTSDAAALAYTSNANASAYTLNIVDTAADLSGTVLNTLQANTHVASIIVSDNGASEGGYVQANVAQLTSDAATLGKLSFANSQTTKTLNVVDTAADISADLAALNTDAQIGQITISDNQAITLTGAAYTGDTTAIGKLKDASAGAVLFDITDTAADLNGASFSNLITQGDAIDVTNIAFAHLTATFTENGAGTSGVLSLTDGTHSASITLFGQYAAAGFSGAATSAGFSTAVDAGTGSKITLLATVPA